VCSSDIFFSDHMESSVEFNCPQIYNFAAPTPKPIKRKAPTDLPATVKKQKCSPTMAQKIYNFEHGSSLRNSEPAKVFEKPCLTQPRPFVLQTSERAEMKPVSKPAEQYTPLAMQLAKWMKETPPRFKREPVPVQSGPPLERTVPHPFQLVTEVRAGHHLRPYVEPAPTPAFRATHLNRKIFTAELGIPVVPKKPSTVPQEFKMVKREASRALPAPAPVPPAFQFKATPAPAATPFRPVLPHRLVSSTPFQLATENRPWRLRSQTEASLQPQATTCFKAQPWQADDFARPVPVPPRCTRPLTETQPFTFRSDRRASVRAVWDEDHKQRLRAKEEALAQREKERQERELAEVKALRRALVHRPMPVRIRHPKASVSSASPAPDAAPALPPGPSPVGSPALRRVR
jgi:hypothetical protein